MGRLRRRLNRPERAGTALARDPRQHEDANRDISSDAVRAPLRWEGGVLVLDAADGLFEVVDGQLELDLGGLLERLGDELPDTLIDRTGGTSAGRLLNDVSTFDDVNDSLATLAERINRLIVSLGGG